MEEGLFKLADYGVIGLALALIIVLMIILRSVLQYIKSRDEGMTTLITNHISHNTDVLGQLKEVIKELCIYIKRNNGK